MADGKLPHSHSIPSSQIRAVSPIVSIKPTVDGYIKTHLDLADKYSKKEGIGNEEIVHLGNVSKPVSDV